MTRDGYRKPPLEEQQRQRGKDSLEDYDHRLRNHRKQHPNQTAGKAGSNKRLFEMSSINRVTLLGRVSDPPWAKRRPEDGRMFVKVVVETRQWGHFQYHDVVATGYFAEVIYQSLEKGDYVYVEGELSRDRIWNKKLEMHRYLVQIHPFEIIPIVGWPEHRKELRNIRLTEKVKNWKGL